MKQKMKQRMFATVLSMMLGLSVLLGSVTVNAATYNGDAAGTEALVAEFRATNPAVNDFTYGYEWQILNYVRSGEVTEEQKKTYCDSVVAALKEENLESFPYASTNAKVCIVLHSMNVNASDLQGYNLIAPLQNFEFAAADMYGLMYSMIALYSGGYDIDWAYIEKLLSYQVASGGFDGYGYGEDADTTAMAIQALAPFYGNNETVKVAVDRGIVYIASQVNQETGAISSWGADSACSTAQAILALCSVGENPVNNEKFVFGEKNLFTGLMGLYCGNGAFGYPDASTPNALATEQAAQAIIAYQRLISGKTSFYDMSDARAPKSYAVLDGANQTVSVKAGTGFSIRVDCPIDKFVGVQMDGVVVDPKYYTVTEGSTIVTFTAEYAKSLTAGKHAVTVNFTDGSATVEIAVADKEAVVTKSPKTGEKLPYVLCFAALFVAGSTFAYRKRA